MFKNMVAKRFIATLLVAIILVSTVVLHISSATGAINYSPKLFAKLDGTESGIVIPELASAYDSTRFERSFNKDVTAAISRKNAGLSLLDFRVDTAKYDVLAFYVKVEDNGTWPAYKSAMEALSTPLEIAISNNSSANVRTYKFSATEIRDAFKNVVPGKTTKVRLPISNAPNNVIRSVGEISFKSTISTDNDLNLKITNVYVEDVFEDVVLIDDEATSYQNYSIESQTTEQVKVGTYSLKINTLANEGWIFYSGFYGARSIGEKNVLGVTQNANDGALRFWLYVEDVTSFDDLKELQKIPGKENIIKFGDCDAPDGKYFVWSNWINQVTENGWNEIVLKFSQADTEVSAPNLSKMDTLYMKFSNGAASKQIYIDDVRISVDSTSDMDDNEVETIEDEVIARLDGSEWPIVHPGTQGLINSADYDATHFDRYFRTITEGDIKNLAYVLRSAAGLPPIGLRGQNVLTFDITVKSLEDNVDDAFVWESYKDYIQIYIRDKNNKQFKISSKDLAEAFECIVPGEKTTVKVSLASIGTNNLNAIDGVVVELSECDSMDVLGIKLENIVARFDENYPTVPEDYTPDKEPEKNQEVIFAKLDGTEWPIVHPGMQGEFHDPNYDAMNFDRYLNFIPKGDVLNTVNVVRNAVSGLEPVSFKDCNVVSVNVWVEDNGAWNDYKNNIEITLVDIENNNHPLSKADVTEAFSNLVPGRWNKVTISLASLCKADLDNLNTFSTSVSDGISEKNLHLKYNLIKAYKNENYPEVPEKNTTDKEPEKKQEVIFAKLDGSEWPIVHPGMQGEFHDPNYDASNVDRYLNYTAKGDILNTVNVVRNAVGGFEPVSFKGCNVVTLNVWVEDNGAWNDYKNNIDITLVDINGVSHPIAKKDVIKAFNNLVPGSWNKVTISLASLYKSELENLNMFSTRVYGGKSDKNLHLKYNLIKAIKNENYPEVPNAPKNNDPYLILNDELGENAWPAAGTNNISKLGARAYSATTYVHWENNVNEGWLIRMGYWGTPLTRTLNIKDITKNGKTGAIRFWVYAENAEEVRKNASVGSGSYCRIGSSSNWDGDSYQWRGWSSQIIKDGWNMIVLPFASADIVGGKPNLEKITSFALKFGENQEATTTVILDDIRVSSDTKSALPISNEPTIKGAKMVHPFEETFGLNAETQYTAFELDLKEKTQGMSSLKFESETGSFIWVYRAGENKIDATGYNCLEFDLYVPAADYFDFASGCIELTSSGIWDQNEISWMIGGDLKVGWNHIKLSFDYASYTVDWKGEKDIDLTAINFMRFFSLTADNYVGKKLTWRIDNMCLTKNGDKKVEKTVLIDNNTGYDITLSAKHGVIPTYGTLKVEKFDSSILPKDIYKKLSKDKNLLILSPTFYKDGIEYMFTDEVKVNLSKDNLPKYKNVYVYRLDINGSFRKISRMDNKAKKQITWSENSRLATYILSDVLIEDKEIDKINTEADANNENYSDILSVLKLPIIIAVVVVILAVVGMLTFKIIKRKKKN